MMRRSGRSSRRPRQPGSPASSPHAGEGTRSRQVTDPGGARPIRWWPRFLLWMLVLSVPAWWLADEYHAGLRAAAGFVLGVKSQKGPAENIEVHATQVLAAYAAMCLASVRAPLARRLVSAALGIILLFGIELLTGLMAIGTDALAGSGSIPAALLRLRDEFLVAPPWLGAPLIWLLLLGRSELAGFARSTGSPARH